MNFMKKFHLIQEMYENEENPKSIFHILFQSKYEAVEIKVPYYDYLRGKVLLEDMRYTEEDTPFLTIDILVILMYLQFLYQVRKGLDLKIIGTNLNHKVQEYLTFRTYKQKIERLTQQGLTTWVLEETEMDIEEEAKKDEPTFAYIPIRIKKNELYRGQILLHDLENIQIQLDITVEELIAVLYIDFIKKLVEKGHDDKIMRSIITSYRYFKEKNLM